MSIKKLELDIAKMLKAYEQEHGVLITDISITRIDITQMGDPAQRLMNQVNVETSTTCINEWQVQ
jgi:hypothetical protein